MEAPHDTTNLWLVSSSRHGIHEVDHDTSLLYLIVQDWQTRQVSSGFRASFRRSLWLASSMHIHDKGLDITASIETRPPLPVGPLWGGDLPICPKQPSGGSIALGRVRSRMTALRAGSVGQVDTFLLRRSQYSQWLTLKTGCVTYSAVCRSQTLQPVHQCCEDSIPRVVSRTSSLRQAVSHPPA